MRSRISPSDPLSVLDSLAPGMFAVVAARLESGGVGTTLRTQRVATDLGLEVNVELKPTA